jgi:hypothetical protein
MQRSLAPVLQSIKPEPVMQVPGLPLLVPVPRQRQQQLQQQLATPGPPSLHHPITMQRSMAPVLQIIKPEPMMQVPGLPLLLQQQRPAQSTISTASSADEIASQRKARRAASSLQ